MMMILQKWRKIHALILSPAVEWNEIATNRDGKDFKFSGVTIIEVRRGKATRIQEYVYDTNILKKAWGE